MRDKRGWAASATVAFLLTAVLPWALDAVAEHSPPVGEQSPPVGEHSPPVSEQSPPRDIVRSVYGFGVISPNGDGCLDSAYIYIGFYWADSLSETYWSITIRNPTGQVVFLLESSEPVPQYSLSWPSGPMQLPEGIYQVTAFASAVDPDFGPVEDYGSTSFSIDLTPPRIVSTLPGSSEAKVSVDSDVVSTEVKANYSFTSTAEVRVVFSEPIALNYWFDSGSLNVYAEGGIPAQGYTSYDWSTNTLTFRANSPGLVGNYRAVVNAKDFACNSVSKEWHFVAAAPKN